MSVTVWLRLKLRLELWASVVASSIVLASVLPFVVDANCELREGGLLVVAVMAAGLCLAHAPLW